MRQRQHFHQWLNFLNDDAKLYFHFELKVVSLSNGYAIFRLNGENQVWSFVIAFVCFVTWIIFQTLLGIKNIYIKFMMK